MSLIYCEINIIPTWSVNRIAWPNTSADQATTYTITDTKLCVSVVTLSTYDNPNLLKQSKSGLLKVTIQRQNRYLDCLIDPYF